MYHRDLEYYIKNFKMDLQEVVFYKEAFREEFRTQKLKVAKMEEQNLEILEIHQELKDSRTMVHAKEVENPKVWNATPAYYRRRERLCVNKNDLAEELEKISKHDQKKTKPLLYTYIRCDDCELSFV